MDIEKEECSLSVIVPTFNAVATVGEQLQALSEQKWSGRWEIVLVNNRCTDDTIHVVRSFRERLPQLRIVDAFAKQGAAYALNTGVRAARGEALAFCDADDVVAEGWVAAMGEGLKRYAFVSGPLETRRLNSSPLTEHRVNSQSEGIQRYTYPPFLPHAGAGNMGVQRRIFEAADGFDESLQALFETDFCWKLQLRGIPLTPLRTAVVHVRHRDRPRELMRQARTYAKYDVILYKRYQVHGMPKLGFKNGIAAWVGLGLSIGDLAREEKRAAYLWELGWRSGRLWGSIRNRTWAL